MKRIIVIALLLLALALNYWPIEVASYDPPDNLDYLILQMEEARDSHQELVDNPWRHWSWQKVGMDQSEWVEIYDQVIEALEGINHDCH